MFNGQCCRLLSEGRDTPDGTFCETVAMVIITTSCDTKLIEIPIFERLILLCNHYFLLPTSNESNLIYLKLPKSCQQCELTFLSTVAFKATKILSTLRADICVAFRAI